MFPNVRPRRLGQRGNSRYCYSGLRKKTNFERPELPDLYKEVDSNSEQPVDNSKTENTELTDDDQQLEERLNVLSNDKNLVLSASLNIILEWARSVFSLKLTSIRDLAKHLILLNYIDKESIAALTVIASDDEYKDDLDSLDQHNPLTSMNKLDKKSLDNFKGKSGKCSLDRNLSSFKKLLTDKKDKPGKKREMMANSSNKKQLESTGKIQKVLKVKKNKMKKDKLKPTASKVKLESFDNLTTKLNDEPTASQNPIEINVSSSFELDFSSTIINDY